MVKTAEVGDVLGNPLPFGFFYDED